ncbi:hypothetical protein [Streptomyces europaeiscabiei]|uniref:hypothetical protein n=1 Tax=Streptomyces europaeiscabiei TaxID=146819 RepID=UPI0029B1024D|nr:hypothetical protein [Streptomyces europaeiscabiei]MDX3616697.1 hypothetical protein [Streptomyces europaeiscabiei]
MPFRAEPAFEHVDDGLAEGGAGEWGGVDPPDASGPGRKSWNNTFRKQQWNVDADGTVAPPVNGGLCLTSAGAGTPNGTQLVPWICDGGNEQERTRS